MSVCDGKSPACPSYRFKSSNLPDETVKSLEVYDEIEDMSKRELIERELDHMPEPELDKLLAFLHWLKDAHAENAMPALASESSLAKDWLAPEGGCGPG